MERGGLAFARGILEVVADKATPSSMVLGRYSLAKVCEKWKSSSLERWVVRVPSGSCCMAFLQSM